MYTDDGELNTNTFLTNTRGNTLIRRSFLDVRKGDMSNSYRRTMKSITKEIKVTGCKEMFRFSGASPPSVRAWSLSFR